MDDATSPAVGVHEICDAYVADYARLQPAAATEFGISGHDDDLPDYSPDGHRARAELARRTLAALFSTRAADESERIAETVFAERIGLEVELHEADLPMAALNSIACPVQELRQAFDLMATDGTDDWAAVARHLAGWDPRWPVTGSPWRSRRSGASCRRPVRCAGRSSSAERGAESAARPPSRSSAGRRGVRGTGDLPAGPDRAARVALGQPEPKPYLRAGDVVELEIEGLGRQRQTVGQA